MKLLASASYDDTILLYVDDPSDDWFPFTTLSGHTSTVWSLAFSPCGSLLASASDDRTLRIWQRFPKPPIVETGQIVRVGGGGPEAGGRWQLSLIIPDAHERCIYSISWTKCPNESQTDGDTNRGWIASGGGDGRIKIWQINVSYIRYSNILHLFWCVFWKQVDQERAVTHQLIAELENAHGVADINCVAWSPRQSDLLASTGDDCTSRIWHVQSTSLTLWYTATYDHRELKSRNFHKIVSSTLMAFSLLSLKKGQCNEMPLMNSVFVSKKLLQVVSTTQKLVRKDKLLSVTPTPTNNESVLWKMFDHESLIIADFWLGYAGVGPR